MLILTFALWSQVHYSKGQALSHQGKGKFWIFPKAAKL
jgi:hypothetical protein